VRRWLDETTPALALYRHTILDEFRRREHVLDENGERILSLAGPTNAAPRTVYEELSTSDIKFPTLTFSDGADHQAVPGRLCRAAGRATRTRPTARAPPRRT
jgi:oligoendopeptidase F